jgi:hypothetical protein
MALKDWVKVKDASDYVLFATKEKKDYNLGQPKHLQVSENLRFSSKNFISIKKSWLMKDVSERKESKALWVVRDNEGGINTTCNSKSQALAVAKKYMGMN